MAKRLENAEPMVTYPPRHDRGGEQVRARLSALRRGRRHSCSVDDAVPSFTPTGPTFTHFHSYPLKTTKKTWDAGQTECQNLTLFPECDTPARPLSSGREAYQLPVKRFTNAVRAVLGGRGKLDVAMKIIQKGA